MDKSGRVLNKKDAISFAVKKLNEGKIIAVKSLGGFQIACNATSDKAVLLLRKRKMRPFKPFAVMFKDLKEIEKYLQTDSMEKASLLSPAAPIVLLKKKHRNEALDSIQQIKPAKNHGSKNNDLSLSQFISFNNKYEGAILPYTPLHHLIFNKIQIPLIMTSGNISEEPIASNNPEALEKLKGICDFFLVHDRDISSKYDDSVLKITDKKEMLVRRGRGFAPYPLKLNFDTGDKVILAVGAHEKNTFCLIKKNYAILSQHIGDLDSLESNDFFQSTLNNYLNLFNIDKIDIVAYDSHPLYSSSIFALNHFKDSKKIKIQHHKAHAASVVAENNLANHSFIAFTWDGTGFGDDNSIWGSEVFVSTGNSPFKRVAHLRKKQLAGGEVTIKKPYRAALIYLFELFKNNFFNYTGLETGMDFSQILFHFFPFYKNIITEVEINIIRKQLNSGFVNPVTTSMGRFFDAVSSILDITHISSFEGQAAIDLEMAASEKTGDFYDAGFINSIENRDKNKTFIIDDYLLFSFILKDINKGVAKNVISARFHNTLAYAVLNISNILREDLRINTVLLTGGVFQNNLLFNKCFQALKKEGFEVYSNFKVPVNDGGISLGQAYLAAQYLKGKHF